MAGPLAKNLISQPSPDRPFSVRRGRSVAVRWTQNVWFALGIFGEHPPKLLYAWLDPSRVNTPTFLPNESDRRPVFPPVNQGTMLTTPP
jgi:hypothetical protein